MAQEFFFFFLILNNKGHSFLLSLESTSKIPGKALNIAACDIELRF